MKNDGPVGPLRECCPSYATEPHVINCSAEIASLRRVARDARANRNLGVALELERIADEREGRTRAEGESSAETVSEVRR